MHSTGYKSALARRACRYSDARPPRKTDGVLLESEIPLRMRGKGLSQVLVPEPLGITPAYAGKRAHGCTCERYSWDHPRVCGEKSMWAVARWPVTGSPPRMRGKGGRVVGRPLDDRITPRMRGKATPGVPTFTVPRITPAYAGKSWQGCYHQGHHEDHPRICGEKCGAVRLPVVVSGSPPHMRGKD